MEVEPTVGGEEEEHFSGTTSNSEVEPDTANTISPNVKSTVDTESQETGSSTVPLSIKGPPDRFTFDS